MQPCSSGCTGTMQSILDCSRARAVLGWQLPASWCPTTHPFLEQNSNFDAGGSMRVTGYTCALHASLFERRWGSSGIAWRYVPRYTTVTAAAWSNGMCFLLPDGGRLPRGTQPPACCSSDAARASGTSNRLLLCYGKPFFLCERSTAYSADGSECVFVGCCYSCQGSGLGLCRGQQH